MTEQNRASEQEARRVGSVCVVTEYRRDAPLHPHLYGVFTTEEVARRDYGDVPNGYEVEFETVPMFGTYDAWTPGA